MPLRLGFLSPQQARRDLVMALTQQIGPDFERLTGDAFDRIAAAVDAREDILDQKARPGRIIGREFGNIGNARSF